MSLMWANVCHIDVDYVQELADNANFAAYSVVTWVHLILGAPGHLILLHAFYKQFKKEQAYMYQVFTTVSEFAELLSWVMLVVGIKIMSGAESGPGFMWWRRSYTLMWYSAHVVHGAFSLFFTCSLLLAVAMTADRVFALAKPMAYRKIKHSRHQFIALGVSLVIGAATCYVEELMFTIWPDGDHYTIHIYQQDIAALFPTVLGHMRNTVRALSLIALIGLNLLLVHFYKEQAGKVDQMTGVDKKDIRAEMRRKKQERILLLLTLVQSAFQIIGVTTEVGYYAAQFFSPWFSECVRGLAAPIMDMTVEICDLLELYATFAVNRQFRSYLPCFKRPAVGATSAISQSQAPINQNNQIRMVAAAQM